MPISKNQLRRIIREEKEKVLDEIDLDNPDGSNGDHHWPRIEWDTAVGELVDKWHDMETATFDPGDPSMMHDGELSQAEAKDLWREQIDAASYDLENDITVEIRKVVLAAMKSVSGKLVNGDYA